MARGRPRVRFVRVRGAYRKETSLAGTRIWRCGHCDGVSSVVYMECPYCHAPWTVRRQPPARVKQSAQEKLETRLVSARRSLDAALDKHLAYARKVSRLRTRVSRLVSSIAKGETARKATAAAAVASRQARQRARGIKLPEED